MGLDVAEIGMGSDLSLDLRYFASRAVRQTKDSPAPDMDAYIRRLEEERGKIEVFRRELPLCARLLADVIDVMKEETEKKKKKKGDGKEEEDGAAGDKSKWMSTAQLWTGGRDAAEAEKKQVLAPAEAKSCGGAFVPFKAAAVGARKDDDKAADARTPDLSLLSPPPPPAIKSAAPAAAAVAVADESHQRQVVGFAQAAARVKAAALAPSGPAALSLQPQPQQTTQQQARKSRRCWSPELHRQFIAALNQLGGPQVATPKQIRELMKVDGLTNDEVKSHLQKYRLHTRRTPAAAGPGVVSQPIVVMGGLWIPHQEQSSSHQSGSPHAHGPIHFSATSGIAVSSAATACSEEEDGRSSEMSYGWK